MRGIAYHICIRKELFSIERGEQYKPIKTSKTGKRYISLSRGKSICQINNRLVKGKPLALMYSNSPSKSQRILGKSTQYFLFYLVRIGLALIANMLPYVFTYLYNSILIGEFHSYLFLGEVYYFAYLSIVIALRYF